MMEAITGMAAAAAASQGGGGTSGGLGALIGSFLPGQGQPAPPKAGGKGPPAQLNQPVTASSAGGSAATQQNNTAPNPGQRSPTSGGQVIQPGKAPNTLANTNMDYLGTGVEVAKELSELTGLAGKIRGKNARAYQDELYPGATPFSRMAAGAATDPGPTAPLTNTDTARQKALERGNQRTLSQLSVMGSALAGIANGTADPRAIGQMLDSSGVPRADGKKWAQSPGFFTRGQQQIQRGKLALDTKALQQDYRKFTQDLELRKHLATITDRATKVQEAAQKLKEQGYAPALINGIGTIVDQMNVPGLSRDHQINAILLTIAGIWTANKIGISDLIKSLKAPGNKYGGNIGKP